MQAVVELAGSKAEGAALPTSDGIQASKENVTILGARASKAENGGGSPLPFALLCGLLTCCSPAYAQSRQPARPVPVQRPKPPVPEPTPPAGAESDESLLPDNWAPELLDTIFSSPN